MSGLGGFLILLAIFCFLSGPIALITVLVTLSRIRELQRQVEDLERASHRAGGLIATVPPRPAPTFHEVAREPVEPAAIEPPASSAAPGRPRVKSFFQQDIVRPVTPTPVEPPARQEVAQPEPTSAPQPVQVEPPVQETIRPATPAPAPSPESLSLEQRIGTRWVLIAGVITVMFAVGYFLKYAYEQHWIGPLGRVLIAGFGGLVALVIGEVTRRRGYDIVAKGVTALGFAILYATVFAARSMYHLIGAPTAYLLSIGVTVGAMAYAVALDEIIIAVLSLIGGYLTPVVLSTGENQPWALFSYVLVLSAGAVACATWRKWGPVNIVVFVGTYLLYTGWFERFYRPEMGRNAPPPQLLVAMFWLAVFFLIYLALPLLHTLIRRVKSAPQDMVLVLANAAVAFYYLWTILHHNYPAALAWCTVGLGVAHLAMTAVVFRRCREDSNLWQTLLVTGAAFITLAVPLYFEVYAIAMLWALEALLLIVVGLRYQRLPVQAAGMIVLLLTVGDLLVGLPLHKASFTPVFNTAFASWGFAAAVLLICHGLYRFDTRLDANLRSIASHVFYVAGLGGFMLPVAMELWCHQELNLPRMAGPFFWRQMTLVFVPFILLLVARPICPRGQASRVVGTLLAGVGAIYTLGMLPGVHERPFTIFLNADFARAILLVAALFASAWLSRRTELREPDGFTAAAFVALGAVLALGILLTEEIWMYFDRLHPDRWEFLARMYIAMLWAAYATALMGVAFWRRIQAMQYLAIGILALAAGDLLTGLPMHTKPFPPVFNTAFVAWFLVAAAILICHGLYRLDKHLDAAVRSTMTQVLYAAGLGVLMAGVTMELWSHDALNLPAAAGHPFFWRQMTLAFAAFILLFATRPVCPAGQTGRIIGTLSIIVAGLGLLATFHWVHAARFTVFFNVDFVRAVFLVAVMFLSAWLLRRSERLEPADFVASGFLGLGLVVVLWLLLTEEIWLYYDRLRPNQWRFMAHMYISILWAIYATGLMVIGFWRRLRPLRYMALGIFVLLLAKIFLVDTRELGTAYRIAGFLVTGLALVGVSYLYQYLKKTGFFDTMLAERDRHDM